MPEGPEIHLSAQYINTICKGRTFTGKIVKSDISKMAQIDWDEPQYSISAVARGKELQITLRVSDNKITKNERKKTPKSKELTQEKKDMKILFNFGMSGRFNFCESTEIVKHSHLQFHSSGRPLMVLCFVDYRRFGRWRVDDNWSPGRGPCTILEYSKFRNNVLQNLKDAAFNKPICETLLNQKYFNGVGNYLRAEILYRARIRPFDSAREVLKNLSAERGFGDVMIKTETPDILQLCHQLELEVINLGCTVYNPSPDHDYSKFTAWLQCYYNPAMKKMVDHNKRTIWYTGDPGLLTPKEIKTKGMKRKTNKMAEIEEESPPKNPRKSSTKTKSKREKGPKKEKYKKSENVRTRITRSSLNSKQASQ